MPWIIDAQVWREAGGSPILLTPDPEAFDMKVPEITDMYIVPSGGSITFPVRLSMPIKTGDGIYGTLAQCSPGYLRDRQRNEVKIDGQVLPIKLTSQTIVVP
jgi:hypothetical protein